MTLSSSHPPVVWTLAGHDPSSGAGITADLLTFAAHGLFACTVPTSLTAQSTRGVAGVSPVPADFLGLSLSTLLVDLPPAGLKIGMLGSLDAATVLGSFLRQLRQDPRTAAIPIVLDPVLVSSSGRALFPPQAVDALHDLLLPHVGYLTPNFAELGTLTGLFVRNAVEATAAGNQLASRHPHLTLIVTGGDQATPTEWLRLPDGSWSSFPGEHLESTSTHGTGCAFSSALLARLILGDPITAAVPHAKRFVTEAIRTAAPLGSGKGPMNLLWPLLPEH